jgi:phospholipid-binding lipoprotein MlaA
MVARNSWFGWLMGKKGVTVAYGFGRLSKTVAVAGALVGLLGGCATPASTTKDPAEGFNRAMFAFNEGLDTVAIKPAAKGYEFVLPAPIRTGVSNFFGNVADIFVGVNNLFQGKPGDAGSDWGRFVINSTFGIFGVFDVATDLGLERHDEDFGQTFGRWGVASGPYLVVPVFGPRTARDAVGLVLDVYTDPVSRVSRVAVRNSLSGLRLISDRTALLPADKIIEEAALDKYSYIRDAYLQTRVFKIYDGSPPRQPESGAP